MMTTLLLAAVLLGLLLVIVLLAVLLTRLQAQSARASLPDPALSLLQNQLNDLRHETQRASQEGQAQVADRLSSLTSNLADTLLRTQEQVTRQLGEVGTTLDRRLDAGARVGQEGAKLTQERLEHTSRALGELMQKLVTLEEGNRRVLEVGAGLRELQDILRAPKLRGGLGEYFLEALLAEILPAEHIELQYGFRSREKVDAVIRLRQGLLPVDAKFPLENFRRLVGVESPAELEKLRREFNKDLRKHIDDIAGKYIVPGEGTLDIAFMYIPAESVYYEAMLRAESAELLHYALSKRVIPVSPASLYAYLQIIVMGLRGLEVEQHAKEILVALRQLSTEFEKLLETIGTLGGHLDKAMKSQDKLARQMDGFGRTLASQKALIESDAEKP